MQPQVTDRPLEPSEPVGDEILSPEVEGPYHTGESRETKFRRQIRASVIQSEREGKSMLDSMLRMKDDEGNIFADNSGKHLMDREADLAIENRTLEAAELFLERGTNPEGVAEAFNQFQMAELEEKANPSRATEEYVTAQASPDLDQQVREDIRVRLTLLDQVSEIAEDISGWEMARDIGLEVALAPKFLVDNAQLTGDLIGGVETTQRTIGWFRGLPAQEKIDYFPILRDHALEAMPRHRAVAFMAALLDPAAEEAFTDEFGIWSAVEVAGVTATIASIALKLRRVLNPINAAAKLQDYDRASEMNMAVLASKDEELGELVGVDRLTAVDNATPFKQDGVNDGADSTISAQTAERIFQFRDRIKQVFGELSEGRSFLREGFLDANDKIPAVKRIETEYEQYIQDRFQGLDKPVELTSTRTDDARGVGFNFEVRTADGRVIKDTYRGIFTTDEVGMWKTLPEASVWKSEKAQTAKTDMFSFINAATRLDLTSANVGAQLNQIAREAWEPIKGGLAGKSRKQRVQEVDDVLIAGDDLADEFTPEQLRAGVNGIKLDEAQIEAYYNNRGVMNGIAIMRNMDKLADYHRRGVKTVDLGQAKQFGEPQNLENARKILRGGNTTVRSLYKFDGTVGEVVDNVGLNLDEAYEQGFQLVKLEDDVMISGQRYRHILTKGENLSDPGSVVLDIRKGYMPRFNPKAIYFVQQFTPSSLDGIQDFTRKAVRSFDNKREADQFAEALQARHTEDGIEIRVNTDEELEAFRAGDSGQTGAHGLFHSPRARTPVPHNDGDAASVPRTSALEAIELYLENTKNFMSRNEWRMGARKKWENTARHMLPGNKNITFDEPGKAMENKALATAHDKISEMSGFRTKSERHWENAVTTAYEWALGKGIPRTPVSDYVLDLRNKDPLATIRSLTFHTLLGWFNPIQLWVQAQGAAVALGVNLTNPQRLQKVFRQQHVLTLMQHADGKLSNSQLKKLVGVGGFKDVDELKQMKEIWDKSGLYQSTLSSADVEAAARGFPITGGGLKKFAQSGLLFFRSGELFNRRFSFLTAVDELGGAAAARASEDVLKQAMDRTNDLILNLGKANRAQFQKGFLSIPTQFLQIQFKTIETILGMNGALTPAERIRVLATQVGLYGAAGVFGGNLASRALQEIQGKDQIDIEEMSPGGVRFLSGGVTDWVAYMIGADITAADRGALLNGMDQTIWSLFTEEMTMFEGLAGPSSVLPTRVATQLGKLRPWIAKPQDINGQTDLTAQDVTDGLRRMGEDIGDLAASPFSVWNQYSKFRLMRDLGIQRDKNGNLIAAPEDGYNWQTEWATLIGFKSNDLQLKFDLSDINQREIDYVRDRSNLLIFQWDKFLMALESADRAGREFTEEEMQQFTRDYKIMVDTLDPHVRRRVLENFRTRIRGRGKGNSQLDRQRKQFWDNMIIRLTDSLASDGDLTSESTRLLQVDPVKEKK